MRGLLNRDGTTFFTFNNWQEQTGIDAGALVRFDLRTDAVPHAAQAPGPQALIDTVPGDTSSTAMLTVGAAPIVSAIDTLADQDFYQITLVAGHEYQIGLFGYTPAGLGDPIGPTGIPLLDSYLELYDSAGNLITAADGGADTVLNGANSGFDALLSFTATETGTYYVNARAFDNIPIDGDDGDMIGDYGLYAKDVTGDESLYTPYYTPDSPLYAIDWGTRVNRVNQTAANPDGDEGTRDTGNARGTPVLADPGLIATLAAQQHVDITGKNVITVYFAQAGDIFVSNDLTNPGLPPATITATGVQGFEHDAVMTALGEFSKVADIVYVEVQDRAQADFMYTSYIGTPGPGVSLLGSMSPPDEPDEGLAQFNSGDERWNALNLQQGGFSFVTLIHEFGHGHGLAHPHDNGGHSGIMNGVESEGVVADYTLGNYDLNQGVFTMMSYEDGWQTSPYGNADTDVGYGYLGGLMAFDIAAIQDKYGVNEDWATGNDVYTLKDENAAGTYYTSIWDGGGNDSIVYAGARDANIDLRAASLQYEEGGGGWVSYAFGIYGGFTIASGVTIENAASGAGSDTLTGNDAANVLNGGAGADHLAGGDGNDTLFVDNALDVVNEAGGAGFDAVYASVSYALAAGQEIEVLSAFQASSGALGLTGNTLAQTLIGNAGANLLDGGGGADVLYGLGGADTYLVDSADDQVIEGASGGTDVIYTHGSYVLTAGQEVEVLSLFDRGGSGALGLAGNALAQTLIGNAGDNLLNGGSGADAFYGLGGNDTYFVDSTDDQVIEGASGGTDAVYAMASYGLTVGQEIEVLSAFDQSGTAALNLTGNGFDQALIGNAGANLLNGGDGADVLYGLGGADTFAFISTLGDDADVIADFSAADDMIALDHGIFAQAGGLGALDANAFVTGTQAADSDDRIIYNSATGQLFYDADGSGGGASVQFATLNPGLSLTASDFTVI
jgi:Ca2+-binding RTX toxin-like protein